MTILEEAAEAVLDRRKNYGSPIDNFERIARFWSVILDTEVDPVQVGLCMIAVKLAREINSHSRDNMTDICGYADCVQQIHEELDTVGDMVKRHLSRFDVLPKD